MNEKEKSLEYWDDFYKEQTDKEINFDDWLDRFLNIINDSKFPIIDLGSGFGNDVLYLSSKEKKVIACDQSINALNNIKNKVLNVYDTKCFNFLDGFPFEDKYTDLVIADLCLHYFKKTDTIKILKEIKRILKNNGHLILRVNSINDINHGAGKGLEVEHHLYMTKDGRFKRFFDEEDFKELFKEFDIEYLKEETMARYSLEKKLYRACLKNK